MVPFLKTGTGQGETEVLNQLDLLSFKMDF